MRDLLPEEAASRRALARAVLASFGRHGYSLVTPPAFEFADVLERGLGTMDPADVLRFVEPESGEVAVLRPDMTPQIARMIATRLRGRPAPYRLSYEGTVLRRRSGRARKHRQIPQVGIELAGIAGPDGDVELLLVAADALRSAGLSAFTMDLGDAGIVRALVEGAAEPLAAALGDALQRKDESEVAALAAEGRLPFGAVLTALVRLAGGEEALDEGTRIVRGTPAAAPVERLRQTFAAAHDLGLAPRIVVDLGEVRGFAYYTGPLFHVFAHGPGEAIGSGGRYDELLARFGAPMPAVGFALDLDRLAWALREADRAAEAEPSVVVVATATDGRLSALRAAGLTAVAAATFDEGVAYARAWGFTFVVDGERAIAARTGGALPSPYGDGTATDAAAHFRRVATELRGTAEATDDTADARSGSWRR